MRRDMKNAAAAIGIAALMIFGSFSYEPVPGTFAGAGIDPPFLEVPVEWVDSVYESLSLNEKIAQLIMVRAYSNRGPRHKENIIELIEKYNIGGICFFQGGPVRQAELTNLYQGKARTPLLIAIDAEWGLGMRLDSTLSYPRQMMLGAIGEEELIYQMGLDIAAQMKAIGIHMNLAPVLDVNNNPNNPVINSRSFGEEPVNVSRKGIAYIKGLQDGGILCTAKHFPGHGDTDSDSHFTLPVIHHSGKHLRSLEIFPFREAINQGLTGVMTAHLHIPSLDTTPGLASSLSHPVVTGILKKELGFRGLVVTDALEMEGVTGYREPGQIEALAFQAGNDILLIPGDIEKAIHTIKREIRRDNISMERIEESCKKILKAKFWAGLHKFSPVDTDGLYRELSWEGYRATQSRLVQASLTLLKNQDGLLPLKNLDSLNIATVIMGDTTINEFQHYIDLYLPATHFNIAGNAGSGNFLELLEELETFDLIIAGLHGTDMRPSRDYGITENEVLFLNELSRRHTSVISLFANPYGLERFDFGNEMQALLMCYEDHSLTQQFAAQLIFGGIPAKGKLPVSSGTVYRAGTGIRIEKTNRLRYGFPEETGMNSRILHKIDSICLDAIHKKAMPGCQVLAARNGLVFYQKSFGYHTYARKDTVKLSDLYDIASLTKIAATLPVLMKLTQDGKFNVQAKLADYLPYLDTTNKGNLVIEDILTHQARLVPWIPFYYKTLKPMDPDDMLVSNKISGRYPFRLAGHVYINKNVEYLDHAYAPQYSDEYSLQVANNMYLNHFYLDTIFHYIINSELLENEEYCYSDLGYYLLQPVIEEMTGMRIDSCIDEFLYKPLGAKLTGYLPLERYPREQIIPTENDLFFRRQLLQGFVHDPGAAMMGGVATHAGVFSNANDLAKIMQMYLNGGRYGEKEFFADSIIDMYNTCIHCEKGNRRGIGFDKPEMDYSKEGPTCQCVSPASFGHSGFTGTMAWADPETGILYIFLSNRIYPDQDNTRLVEMNIRTKIQEVVHDARLY